MYTYIKKNQGNSLAQFTYVSNIGQSVIDFVWPNSKALKIIKNFEIDQTILNSDHLIRCLSIKIPNAQITRNRNKKE